MIAPFLPPSVQQLTEPASVELVKQMQRCPVQTPLISQPIETAFVHQGQGGTPIVLLHGFDSSLLEFRFLLPLLAAQQETWLVDLLGFGFTDRPSGLPCNPMAIRLHLHHFWQQQVKQPMILVGASMGGATAIDFALTYPDAVTQLILIDSAAYSGPPPFVKLLFPPLDYLAVEYLRQRKLKTLELGTVANANSGLLDLLRCSVLHTEMPGWHDALISFTKSGGYGFLARQIPKVSQPTLILWGEADDILGTADATRFEKDIAQSQLIWIKDAKHVPQLEQPQITAQHILAFSS